MLRDVLTKTNVAFYLMAATGVLGLLAKLVNQFTLSNLLKASGNMSKSTHRLIKLIRAKYEHTCMIHDSVENIDAFVEKYIYEYRGFLFRIHTWRQIELLSVWFAGILAAMGAGAHYMQYGFNETVYRYLATGIAEIVFLSVIQRISDEPYKINAVKMYMMDYLENICTFRFRRLHQSERDEINVIAGENGAQGKQKVQKNENQNYIGQVQKSESRMKKEPVSVNIRDEEEQVNVRREDSYSDHPEQELSIRIEGEPRRVETRKKPQEQEEQIRQEEERPALREEAIRQILEEFLA